VPAVFLTSATVHLLFMPDRTGQDHAGTVAETCIVVSRWSLRCLGALEATRHPRGVPCPLKWWRRRECSAAAPPRPSLRSGPPSLRDDVLHSPAARLSNPNAGSHPHHRQAKQKGCPFRDTPFALIGGGGGNRTRVREPSARRSTCLFTSIVLTVCYPTDRENKRRSLEKFNRSASGGLHGDLVSYDA